MIINTEQLMTSSTPHGMTRPRYLRSQPTKLGGALLVPGDNGE
jgi:hypothetical protein